MIEEEAVLLARYVRAICPQQKFDEYTADVWFDLLQDHELDECKQAAVTLGRTQPFIAPSEIIAEVRRHRETRLRDFEYLPDPDETPTQYLANRRRQIAAVAAGHRAPALPAPPRADRPTVDTDQIGRIPGAEPKAKPAVTARDIRCPYCKADPGKPCKTGVLGRRMVDVHPSRADAFKGA